MPKVSVIIPTYNSASYIIEAVESVLNQTYKDFEVIVVDDGSTDNTHTLLEPYLDRIMYRFQENRGESIARNEGIRIAQGEYITFLDSDDWWMPSKLERQVPLMEAIPEAVLAYAYSITVDDKSQPIKFRGRPYVGRGEAGLSSIFDRLVISNCITNANTVIVRNEILEKKLYSIQQFNGVKIGIYGYGSQ
jgi:glycosyltransferase involved in cell wall biosynthesis